MLKKKRKQKDYFKPVRVDNFCTRHYVEYESNGDRS